MDSSNDFFSLRLSSSGHTAIYKVHKYFARRPHNQFRALIEHYVPPDGVFWDCFAGGGVSLVEALTSSRRVIASDINPIASLIQHAEVAEVDAELINSATSNYAKEIHKVIGSWFSTNCRKCELETRYRWVERAYIVLCPKCSASTRLDEGSKATRESGGAINGEYVCSTCFHHYKSVSVRRVGSEILRVRYKCVHCGFDDLCPPSASDISKAEEIETRESEFKSFHELSLPEDKIPMNWDRQAEDALARKGFERFVDLFTPRNRIFMAMLLAEHAKDLTKFDEDQQVSVLTQISALLRYINSMTFSTSSWMDGRPVAWAKHAYWTPNQFIEVNPFEYLEHRQLATTRWESDRNSRFSGKRRGTNPQDVVASSADYAIICGDSRQSEIPSKSMDAVITDPPFGSNVQYGELTHFWEVWLGNLNPYRRKLFELEPEILVHRKQRENSKSVSSYQSGLFEVFAECHRVLKDSGSLVFTFNNKSPEVWFAVMNAAVKAGFYLPQDGIHYIEEIKAYRDTSHLRFSGELQGDVLYTFRKRTEDSRSLPSKPPRSRLEFLEEFRSQVEGHDSDDRNELAVKLQLDLIRQAAKSIETGGDLEDSRRWLKLLRVPSVAKRSGKPILEAISEAIAEIE